MTTIGDIHRDETIAYVLQLVRGLHEDENARTTIYSRQPHAVALEHIARERAGRLEQLVRAIEAGLFDQLDASETGSTASVTTAAFGGSAPDLIGEMDRHTSAHGTTSTYDMTDAHDALLAQQAREDDAADRRAYDAESEV